MVQDIIASLGLAMAMIFVAGIIGSFLFGRILGLASFASAFLSGYLVLSMTNLSIYLLVLAFLLAVIAPVIHGDKGRNQPNVAPPR